MNSSELLSGLRPGQFSVALRPGLEWTRASDNAPQGEAGTTIAPRCHKEPSPHAIVFFTTAASTELQNLKSRISCFLIFELF